MKFKKLFVLFLFSFASIIVVNGQTENIEAKLPENQNIPEIKFDKIVNDYGSIKKGADGSCEFKFKNIGKEALVLSNVVSSCGCTVPTWPREPVLPGKSAVIKVVYDTKRLGAINKTITVISNAKSGNVTLSIKGTIIE